MLFEIKSRFTGSVLFSLETESMKLCVEAAVKQRAYLRGADLQGAYLRGADLRGADLQGAYLQGAYLQGAYLQDADLQGAYLRGAYLRGAYLQGADLQDADLQGADLQGAYLRGADLRGADLQGAYLQGAYLQGANLQDAKNLKEVKDASIAFAQLRITPQEGAFVGWKKLCNGVIAKLVIPHDAKRMNALGSRKCRAERVFVHEMFKDGKTFTGIGIGTYDNKTQYITGKETPPDSYDEDIAVECSHGIHFFLTREEAENYF